MKKFILSMLLTVLMTPFAMHADELTIGEQTGSGYYSPFNNFYNHSWNETIYQASEFDGAASITSIAYHCASVGETVDVMTLKVYMGETTKSEFVSSSDWTPESDLTLVYQGSDIVLGDTEWEEIVLDQPFLYSGVNNLVVVVSKSADDYNSYLKWYYTDFGNKPCMYLQNDYYESYADYPTQTGVQYAYSPDIKIAYEPVPSGPVSVTPNPIDLGPRPNNAWMRPFDVTVKPLGGYSKVAAIEATNPYFDLSGFELPTTIYANAPIEMQIAHGEGEGNIDAQIAIFYEDERGVELVDVTAYAYDPEANDVVETAEEVAAYPFVDAPANIYDNYLLPGETPDGQDAVYKVTFDKDVLFTASVDGENGKVAIYEENFGGEQGPGATNMYEGIEISDTPAGPSAAWLKYDDGTLYTSIGVGATYSFFWAVKFTPEDLQSYAGTSLTKISMYDYAAHTGTFLIYQGGESAPQTQVGYQSYAGTGASTFVDYELEYPVAIDATQPLWIIAANNLGVDYPAAASAFTGNPNGSWCSLDGVSWMDVADPTMLGSPLTWMIRGYVQDGAKGETSYKPLEFKPQAVGGELASALPMNNATRATNAINDMVVPAGTYYVAASATSDFTININNVAIPLPEKAVNPEPANMAQNITDQMLSWEFGAYTVEYQLLFGTTYPPTQVVVDWTNELVSAYSATDLYNNTNYFWQVNERNSTGITYGDVWGFTTTLNVPKNVAVSSDELYLGETTTVSWTAVEDRSYRGYNVYVNGEKYNNALITETSYVLEGLEYNMDGHHINVTAVYDEGESEFSKEAVVYVTGNGFISGNVYELDGVTIIPGGGTLTVSGKDAFGVSQSYDFIIDEAGAFEGELVMGKYTATASVELYQDSKVKFEVAYADTTFVNVIMTEVYTPVKYVKATEVEDDVQVVWGMKYYGAPGEDFETGDFSANEWNNEVSSYPWAIVEGGCESDYAMKSTCEGVQNGISAIEITVEVPYDGIMGFNYKVSSEQAWDLGNFYI
ncbi:MAG: fibronectin type III domain-containing protein, partial [Bacteroidales bacterium]|nr:fibronectin type III domain-containing protein [Bacteroidales bacterium]